jgi:triphosphoribosyl-dephospho-CoA synthase
MSIFSESVKNAFVGSCLAELEALKPGNVHKHAAGHGMSVDDFVRSANAAAPAIAMTGLGVGERIFRAVEATREAVGQNTNLGVILLAAPLAQAAMASPAGEDLRTRLGRVLGGLDVEDARWAFRAIALANPGGLGSSARADVRGEATESLLEAMREASGRDRVALAYVTDYEDVFGFGLPRLEQAQARWSDARLATVYLYMSLLAAIPDSHIVRKFGRTQAESVSETAQMFAGLFDDAERMEDVAEELMDLDAAFKSENLNPGTTADLTVATLFAQSLGSGKKR